MPSLNRIQPALLGLDLCDIVPDFRLRHARFLLDRVCGQLQHCSPLSRNEIGDPNDRAVRKFQRVVMMGWLIEVYLAKPSQPFADVLTKPQPGCLYFILECDLGPRTKTHGD